MSTRFLHYPPYGSALPGLQYAYNDEGDTSKYRFGVNGKSTDNEISNLGIQDYGERIYNVTLGKFLSINPLTKSYPHYTTHQFAGNKPKYSVYLDSLEESGIKAEYRELPKKLIEKAAK
jgi:hypothetical protein